MKIPYIKHTNGKCIAGVVAIAVDRPHLDRTETLLMVAWEWEPAAKVGRFKCYHNYVSSNDINEITIEDVANYGKPMSDTDIKKYFPFLLR